MGNGRLSVSAADLSVRISLKELLELRGEASVGREVLRRFALVKKRDPNAPYLTAMVSWEEIEECLKGPHVLPANAYK